MHRNPDAPSRPFRMLALAVFFAGAMGAAGRCGRETMCTEIGCADTFALEVRSQSGSALPSGTYSLDLQPLGGTAVTADCTVVSGTARECNGAAGELLLTLAYDGSAFDAELTAPWGAFADADDLAVVLSLGNDVLVDLILTPDFEESYPNGVECDEIPCSQASETIALSSF